MRRVTILATLATTTMAACNLLSGVGDLSADGPDPSLLDASNEQSEPARDGASGLDASMADAAPVDASYSCVGASCFDAGVCGSAGDAEIACPVKIFAAGTGAIGAIAADAHGVYWTMPATRTIRRLLVTASAPDVLVSVPDGTPTALAIGTNGVYWTESDSGRVRYVASTADAGAAPAATMAGQGGVSALGVGTSSSPAGELVVWTNDAGAITIAPNNIAQTAPVASGQAPVIGVGVSGFEVFWASAGTVNAIRGAGSSAAADVVTAVADLRAIVVDASHLYWTTGTGRVESSTHTGMGRFTILNEGEPVAIAVAGSVVYWVNDTDGQIWALHR